MDVHRDFCEVAIAEDGEVKRAGRIESRPQAIELFAQSLASDDQVVLEATFGAAKIAELIKPHVARVVVCDARRLKGSGSRKTDRRDAKKLAEMLASGYLDEVWAPDEQARTLRRLVARRASLMRARTRAKNEVHAALGRNLCPRPPMKDLFGKSGRRWLAEVELPVDEQLTVDGCVRQIDFLEVELGELDRALAEHALASEEVRRLMTVPGVNMQTAIAFMASVGDVGRFSTPRKLVANLGLDPRVRQSGESAARHGRISKAGNSEARHMLREAAWSVAMTPGPMKAFFERIRARRGVQVAATATARKLSVLFWHLLIREEDYAFARPSMTRKKLRELELRRKAPARAPARRRPASQPEDQRRRAGGLRAGRDRLSADGDRLALPAEEEGRRRDTGARI